jgi:hypothetical protein
MKLILLFLLSLFLVKADTVLYSTGTLLSGGGLRGSRTISTDYCKSLTFYNQLNCSSAYALLTYSVTDQLSNLPINQSALVVGPNDDIIAYNWTLFLNGMLVKTLGFASVTSNDYWLGDFTSNCDQWTTSSRCLNAVYGKPNWPFLSYGKTGCSNLKSVVCVCDAGTVLGTPGPTTNTPSGSPTRLPTVAPSLSPSTHPTTLQPSKLPTVFPSASPSTSPTIRLESDLLTFYAQENQPVIIPDDNPPPITLTSAVEYSIFAPFLTNNGTAIQVRQPGNYLFYFSGNVGSFSTGSKIRFIIEINSIETVNFEYEGFLSIVSVTHKNVFLNLNTNDTIEIYIKYIAIGQARLLNAQAYIKEIKDQSILVFDRDSYDQFGIDPPDYSGATSTVNKQGIYEYCFNRLVSQSDPEQFNVNLNSVPWITSASGVTDAPTPSTAVFTTVCNVELLDETDQITYTYIDPSYKRYGFLRLLANTVVSTWSLSEGSDTYTGIYTNIPFDPLSAVTYGIDPPDVSSGTNVNIENEGVYMARFSTMLDFRADISGSDSVNNYAEAMTNTGNMSLATDFIVSADNISFAGNFFFGSTLWGGTYGRCYAIKLFDNVAETCHAVSISNDNCLKHYLSAWRAVPSETLYLLLTSDTLDCSSDGQQNTNLGLGSAISRFKLSENEYNYSCYYVAEQGSIVSGPFTTSPTPYTTATIAPTLFPTTTLTPTTLTPTIHPTTNYPTNAPTNVLLTYVQQGSKLVGTGNSGAAQQGFSVCISKDNSTFASGGFADNSNQGATWIFVRTGSSWTQQGSKLVGTGNSGAARQGYAVSLSSDGNTLASGGYTDNSNQGATWIFVRTGSSWAQQGSKLVGTGNSGAAFQGYAVSLSYDGNTLASGGRSDAFVTGAVWIFTRSGTTWTQQGSKLVGTGNSGFCNQGSSVSLSSDGNTLASGGNTDNSNQGATWIFVRTGSSWTQQGSKLVGTGNSGTAQQGYSVSLSSDGNTLASGGYTDNSNQGATWIFVRTGSSWAQQGSKLVGTGNSGAAQQGFSVSLSSDGNTLASGGNSDAFGIGSVWIYVRTGTTWTQRLSKLTGTGLGLGSQLGNSVSLSNQADFLVAGANADSSSQGANIVFIGTFTTAPTRFPTTLAPSTISPTLAAITSNYASDLSQLLVACNSTQVISRFNLKFNPNNTVYYEYYCVSPRYLSDEWLECQAYNTSFVDYGLGIYFTQLELLDVSCPIPGQAIQSFKLLSEGTQIAYTYTCCLPETITSSPSRAPTLPTSQPSASPSRLPTSKSPSKSPTLPTSQPSFSPSSSPTCEIKNLQDGSVISNGNNGFGYAVDMYEDTLVVGSPYQGSEGAVNVYYSPSWTTLDSTLTPNDASGTAQFGVSVSLWDNWLAIGGSQDDSGIGAVWIFLKTGSSWAQNQPKLVPSDYTNLPEFGTGVSLRGNTLAVAAPYDDSELGAVWIFINNAGTWEQQGAKITAPYAIPFFGYSVSLNTDEDKLAVGNFLDNSLSLYEFVVSWDHVNTVSPDDAIGDAQFGTSVSFGDFNNIYVGGPGDDSNVGAYWKFDQSGLQLGSKNLPSDNVGLADFGISVRYLNDANLVIIGGSRDDSFQGATWIFDTSGTQLGSKFVGSGSTATARQGFSVAGSLTTEGLRFATGTQVSTSGAAWVFFRACETNAPTLNPTPPTNAPSQLPTQFPTQLPTLVPTSKSPSLSPSTHPTTLSPTFSPTSAIEANSMTFIFANNQPVLADWRDMQMYGDTRIGSGAPYFNSYTEIYVPSAGQYFISFSTVPDYIAYSGTYSIRILINGVSVYEISSTVNLTPFYVTGSFLTNSLTAGNLIRFQQTTNSGAVRYLNPYSSRNLGYVKKTDDLGSIKLVLNSITSTSSSGTFTVASSVSVGSPGGSLSGSQFTITDSGLYEITLNLVAVCSSSAVFDIVKNLGTVLNSQFVTGSSGSLTPITISNTYNLVATDVITFNYLLLTTGTLSGGLSNFAYIRRLRSDTITTTWNITPSSPISQGTLGYAPFQSATAYGNDGVTVSTTASPTASNTVGRITFNVAATYQVKIISNVNVQSGQTIEYSAVFAPIWDNYFPTKKTGGQPFVVDYIGYFNRSQTLNLFALQTPTPAPVPTFGANLRTMAVATKVGNTYSENCGPDGIITVTGDNCQTSMQTYYVSTSNADRYEITLPGIETDCEAKGLSGNPTKGKAMFSMRLYPAQSLTTPTPSPAIIQYFYFYGCRYINDQNSPSYSPSPYTATPTPFTTYSPTQSRYSIDLSNQNTVDCRPYSAAISYFTLTYNAGAARIAYNFRCTPFKVPPGYYLQCTMYYTSYEDWGAGYATVFLDRVAFTCPNPNQAVAYFLLEAVPASSLQRYQYVCCETLLTTAAPTTLQPTKLPTRLPSLLPTLLPTSKSPSRSPTTPTTLSPSRLPTTVPSLSPTVFPESSFVSFSIPEGQPVSTDTILDLDNVVSIPEGRAPIVSNSTVNQITITITGNYLITVTVTIPSATSNLLDLKVLHSTTSYNCYSQIRYQTPMTNAQSITVNCLALNVAAGTYFYVNIATYGNTVLTTSGSSGFVQLLQDTGITTFTFPNNARFFNGALPAVITLANVATSGTTSLNLASNRFTSTSAGLYQYSFSTSAQVDNVNQGAGLYVYVNGAAIAAYVIGFTPNTFMYNSQITNLIYLNTNDIIDFRWDAGASDSVTTHGAGYNFGYLRRLNPSVRATYANVINSSPITSPTCAGIQLNSPYYSHSDSPLITSSPTPTPTTGRVTIRSAGYYAFNLNGNVRPATNNLLTYCFAGSSYFTRIIQTGFAINFNAFTNPASNGNNFTLQAGVATGTETFASSTGGRTAIIKISQSTSSACGLALNVPNVNCLTFHRSTYVTTSSFFLYQNILTATTNTACPLGSAIQSVTIGNKVFTTPVSLQAFYQINCQFIAPTSQPTTFYTSPPTPFTSYNAFQARVSLDLANQIVDCTPYSAAISSFILYQPTAYAIAYNFSCTAFNPVSTTYSCQDYFSSWVPWGFGYDTTALPAFSCPLANQAVARFQLITEPDPNARQRYQFTCCRDNPATSTLAPTSPPSASSSSTQIATFILSGQQPVYTTPATLMLLNGQKRFGNLSPFVTDTWRAVQIQTAGNYVIYWTMTTLSGGTGLYYYEIKINGADLAASQITYTTANLQQYVHQRFVALNLNPGDLVTFAIRTDGATSYTTTGYRRGSANIYRTDDLGIYTFFLPSSYAIPVPGAFPSLTFRSSTGSPEITYTDVNKRLTINTSGFYQCGFIASTQVSAGSKIVVFVNGVSEWFYDYRSLAAGGPFWFSNSLFQTKYFTAGDYITFQFADGGTTNSNSVCNMGYIRRLATNSSIEWPLTASQVPNTADTLTNAVFSTATNVGSFPVTISTTASPTASPLVGQIAFSQSGVYEMKYSATFRNPSSLTSQVGLAEQASGTSYINTLNRQNGWVINTGDRIDGVTSGTNYNIKIAQSPTPAPVTGIFPGDGANRCFIDKLADLTANNCFPAANVTNDNCIRFYQTPYTVLSSVFAYQIVLPAMSVYCNADGEAPSPVSNGRAITRLQFTYLNNVASPTLAPSAPASAYIYGCKYVATQATGTTSFSTSPTTYTGFYNVDLALQTGLSCQSLSRFLARFVLVYTAGSPGTIRYDYHCVAPTIPAGMSYSCTTYYTTTEDNGSGTLVFIDRITFSCPLASEALAGFYLQAVTGSTQRYVFTCCKVT